MVLYNPEFWQIEDTKLWGAVDEIALAALLAGAGAGRGLLPKSLQSLANQETFNAGAMRYLRMYRLKDIPNINQNTRRHLVTMINEWLRSGDSMQDLEIMIAAYLNSPRALQIAVTEITRLFAQGNLLIWNSIGSVTAKVWQTARDEKVCPLCGPLHNQVVSLESNFSMPIADIANSAQMKAMMGSRWNEQLAMSRVQNMMKWNGSEVHAPPRHVNCRCWLKPVVDVGAFGRSLEQDLGLS